ncbi:MAG: hypothetical protein CM1200mP26_18270 [Acidimicrobiales bacterium]|nr:MAG: hypothetical protein CM1200mP26_18270 [Acidimicrobiales bacterium]
MGVGGGPAGTVVGGTVVVVVDDVELLVVGDSAAALVEAVVLDGVGATVVGGTVVGGTVVGGTVDALRLVVDEGGRTGSDAVVGAGATPSTTDGSPQAATSRTTVAHRIHTARSSQTRARSGTVPVSCRG